MPHSKALKSHSSSSSSSSSSTSSTTSSLKKSNKALQCCIISLFLLSVVSLYLFLASNSFVSLPISPNSSSASPSLRKDSTIAASASKSSNDVIQTPPPRKHDKGVFFLQKFYEIQIDPNDKDLILGMAVSLDPKSLAIFAGSLREEARCHSTVILFVNSPIDGLIQNLATKYSLHLLEYQLSQLSPSFLQNYHPSSLRWVFYHRLLQENQAFLQLTFQKILTVDVRDSYFQSNPFTPIDTSMTQLYAFGEDHITLVKDSPRISRGISDCFGPGAWNNLGFSYVIVSGVNMGIYPIMSKFIQVMANLFLGYYGDPNDHRNINGIPTTDPSSKFPSCEKEAIDQSVLNYIIHNKLLLFNTQILYPESFPVINLQSGVDIYKPEASGIIRQQTSRIPFAIVHQYDRNYEFQLALAKRYVSWIDWSSDVLVQKEWSAAKSCQDYIYKKDIDLFRGICDIGEERGMTAVSCCEICNTQRRNPDPASIIKKCTGFTFLNGVCYLKDCSLTQNELQLSKLPTDYQQLVHTGFFESNAISAYLSKP